MIDLAEIRDGTRLRISGGIVAEVVRAIDGEWLRVRLIEVPAGKGVAGEEELCHATDILKLL